MYGCTWEAGRALEKLEKHLAPPRGHSNVSLLLSQLPAYIHDSRDFMNLAEVKFYIYKQTFPALKHETNNFVSNSQSRAGRLINNNNSNRVSSRM